MRRAGHDLKGGGGVMKLAGFDAGCTPTLLPAGGILNIPNFGTHHKRNRMTAMALVHRPDADVWTEYELPPKGEPVVLKRAGFNFGAPGDRRADDGVLWLRAGAKTPGVSIAPATAEFFQFHGSRVGGSWVASSGVSGATEITVPTTAFAGKNTKDDAKRRFDIRLHFAEPDDSIGPGQRVFSVQLEGRAALAGLDVVKAAGGANKPLVRDVADVEVAGPLNITLTATSGQPLLCGVELIAK